ncbi:MAG: cytochrome c maturation protein CcmE [Candidatus Methanomethylicia archaeon]
MKAKILIIALTILLIFYLTISTLTLSQRYLSPSEVFTSSHDGEIVAIIGIVENPRIEGSNLVFIISDNKTKLTVIYQGSQALLREGGEVVVEGLYSRGEVLAFKILTKCPSRYGFTGYVDVNTIIIPLAISISISIILIIAVIIIGRRSRSN